MGITLKRALTPGGRPTSIASPSISPIDTSPAVTAPVARVTSSSNPFRRSTVLSSPFTRTSSAASITSNSSAGGAQSPVIAQRYTQANLTGGAGGRFMKLLGDFYLLVGQYGDAIKCYDDGAERCRVAGDVLWEGVAREGRAVAAICEAWEARDGSVRLSPSSRAASIALNCKAERDPRRTSGNHRILAHKDTCTWHTRNPPCADTPDTDI